MSTSPLAPEERLTQQERANFLEDFIHQVTAEIDEILAGRNFEAEIKALKFRIALLQRGEGAAFAKRTEMLREKLERVEREFAELRPRIDALETERRFYRSQTSGF